jgi:hypothetical protein
MGVDAFAIAGASLATIVIAKIKFYVKKNGVWTCGCGFMDKPLVDDDEIEIKQFELSDNVKGIYVKPKGHIHHEHTEETDTE